MSDLNNELKQCGKPAGRTGEELVGKMNDRHFPLITWGLGKAPVSETDIILDIGCGGGRTIATLAEKASRGKVYGIDHSEDCVRWSKEYNRALVEAGRVEVIHSSVEKMPFRDHFFSLVTAVETIYFWPGIVNNLKEVRRVLKPGGKILIVNEMYLNEKFREENEKHMATGLLNIYSPEQIGEFLAKAGFQDISIDLVEEKNWLRALASTA